MTDHIRLNDMVFYGYHGVQAEERVLGQRFIVDLELGVDLRQAGQTDDLAQTVNYAEVFNLARDIVTGPAFSLIEAVAERIAAEILRTQPLVEQVRVDIRKPGVPLPGSVLGSAEIRIERVRRD